MPCATTTAASATTTAATTATHAVLQLADVCARYWYATTCAGIMRKDAPQLQFGLDYEQEIAKSWTEDLDVTCYLPELEAGRYNYTVMVNHLAPGVIVSDDNEAGTKMLKGPKDGLGYGRFGEKLVSARGGDAKLFLVLPQTEELSTQKSGKFGGHLVTITGSGFDTAADCADNDVRLSGIKCRVLSCTGTELQCVAGPANPLEYVPPAPFVSTHGLDATTHAGVFDKVAGQVSGVAMTTTTWHDPMVGGFKVPIKRYGVTSLKLSGYFVAPYSAYYSFYSFGDVESYCSLSVGTSHNTSSSTKQRMSFCGETLLSDRKKIYLDKGHRYHFEHQHRLAGADDTFRAAVRIHAPALQRQWTKTKEESQYHSWEEIQTVAFTPSFIPEVMELTVTNIWGGSFKLYNTARKTTSGPIRVGEGVATATADLTKELRKNSGGVMRKQHCWTTVSVQHVEGDPSVDHYIKFRLTYGCMPRSTGNEAHAYWGSIRLVTNDLISNLTSTTTTATTTTNTNTSDGSNTTTVLVDTTNSTNTPGSNWDAGPGFGLKGTLLQLGSKALGGTFRLSLNGFDYTRDLPVGTSGDSVAYWLKMDLSLVREVSVTKVKNGHGILYKVNFHSQGQNMPMLKVWDTDLTPRTTSSTKARTCPQEYPRYEQHTSDNHGDVCRKADSGSWDCPSGCTIASTGVDEITHAPWCLVTGKTDPCRQIGASVTTTVAAITDGGGNDLYYDPIPADFFERVVDKPQAVITVNGINAECATHRDVSGPSYDKTFDPYYAIDKAVQQDCNGDPSIKGCSFSYVTRT